MAGPEGSQENSGHSELDQSSHGDRGDVVNGFEKFACFPEPEVRGGTLMQKLRGRISPEVPAER